MLPLPVTAHQVVAGESGLIGERCEHLVYGAAAIKRIDQRLDNAGSAIEGASVSPGLQMVRLVNVPLADVRSFVVVCPEMNPQRDLHKLRVALAEVHVSRRSE